MEAKEILEKALEFFEDHEWIQGSAILFDDGWRSNIVKPRPDFEITGACLEGACHLAARGKQYDALDILGAAIDELHPGFFGEYGSPFVHIFNDDPATTREDAMLALKHAIEKA